MEADFVYVNILKKLKLPRFAVVTSRLVCTYELNWFSYIP